MEVSEPWFTLIYSGLKLVEGRKNSPKWSKIKVGDKIKIINEEKFYYVRVMSIASYPSSAWEDPLLAYLQFEGLNNALPGLVSLEEGKRVYHQWSTPEEIKQYGFIGIRVKLIN